MAVPNPSWNKTVYIVFPVQGKNRQAPPLVMLTSWERRLTRGRLVCERNRRKRWASSMNCKKFHTKPTFHFFPDRTETSTDPCDRFVNGCFCAEWKQGQFYCSWPNWSICQFIANQAINQTKPFIDRPRKRKIRRSSIYPTQVGLSSHDSFDHRGRIEKFGAVKNQTRRVEKPWRRHEKKSISWRPVYQSINQSIKQPFKSKLE